MSQYIPNPPPSGDLEAVKTWLYDELQRVARCASEANDRTRLTVSYAYPTKYSAGDVIYADGTTLNPGSGEGVYRRNKTNTAWAFLG